MESCLRIGMIAYLNTLPLRTPAVGEPPLPTGIEWQYESPAALNAALLAGDLDAAWVSSHTYLQQHEAFYLPWVGGEGLCIASRQQVQSVFWACKTPASTFEAAASQQETLWVSSESATSVAVFSALLTALLPREVAKRLIASIRPYPQGAGFDTLQRQGNALMIGDEALAAAQELQQSPLPYWDMATLWQAWQQQTHPAPPSPLVFGLWVARSGLSPQKKAAIDALSALWSHRQAVHCQRATAFCQQAGLAPSYAAYFTDSLCYQLPQDVLLSALHRLDALLAGTSLLCGD